MGPRATSKRSFSTSRCTMAILFIDLRRTWSPTAMCLRMCGWALASPDIRAGAVGDDGLVEALLKLAAQAQDAAFGFLGELLLPGAIFDGAHRLAHLELEVLEQRGQLGFQLAGAVAQLDVALAGEPGSLLVERVLLGAGGLAVLFELREFAVQRSRKRAMSTCCEPRRWRAAAMMRRSGRAARRFGCRQTRRERRGAVGSWARA
jgi:hypothetical protein